MIAVKTEQSSKRDKLEVGHSGTQGDKSGKTERKKRRMLCDKYYKKMGERQRDTAGDLRKKKKKRK